MYDVSRREALQRIAYVLGGMSVLALEGCGGGGSDSRDVPTTRVTGTVDVGRAATRVIAPFDTVVVENNQFSIATSTTRPYPLIALDSNDAIVAVIYSDPAATSSSSALRLDADSTAQFVAALGAGQVFADATELAAFRAVLGASPAWPTLQQNVAALLVAGPLSAGLNGAIADSAFVRALIAVVEAILATNHSRGQRTRSRQETPSLDGFYAEIDDDRDISAVPVQLRNGRRRTLKVFRRPVYAASYGAVAQPHFVAALP